MAFRQQAGGSLLVLAMPLREVASRLSLASHDFTYGSGFQMISGGPAVWMYMQEDIWPTVSNDRRGEHISFIALNLRSHTAVLTGTVSIANNSFRNSGGKTVPLLSLNSRKASFVTDKDKLNHAHKSRSSLFPYSGATGSWKLSWLYNYYKISDLWTSCHQLT